MRTIFKLEDVKEQLPNGFNDVCIEISPVCNAKCKYCPSGMAQHTRKMMDPELFEKAVRKLLEYGIIGKGGHVNLFWWGEPMLHPQLERFIMILQDVGKENGYQEGIPYILSTNAYHYRHLKPQELGNIERLIISLPGFSQSSYDKIHEFNFSVIEDNVRRYAEDFEAAGKKDRIWVAYHVYQFNLLEIYDCYSFCNSLGISFNPGFAFPLLVKERVDYAQKRLEPERRDRILKEIVTDQLDRMINLSDKRTCVYQIRNFILDENADVYSCLNIEPCGSNFCGNLLSDDINKIIQNVANLPECDECIKCGVAPTDYSFKFFFNDWFQLMKLREFYESRISKKEKNMGELLLLLRDSEVQHEGIEDTFDIIIKKMKDYGITIEDIKYMIDNYAMRPRILEENFTRFYNEQ